MIENNIYSTVYGLHKTQLEKLRVGLKSYSL